MRRVLWWEFRSERVVLARNRDAGKMPFERVSKRMQNVGKALTGSDGSA